MNDQQIENEIQAKQLTAPRVTQFDLEAAIAREHYFTAQQGVLGESIVSGIACGDGTHNPLRLLTFCVLVLRNGFTVTGESACVSHENFDAEIGRKVALANAKEKLWPLLGYALKEKLAATPADYRDRVRAEYAELDERYLKLNAFVQSEQFQALSDDERKLMTDQYYAMGEYRDALANRIRLFDEREAEREKAKQKLWPLQAG